MEAHLHSFLTAALDGGVTSTSHSVAAFISGGKTGTDSNTKVCLEKLA